MMLKESGLVMEQDIITYDENYIYALANRNSSAFGEYDHFNIYFDTDPQAM